MTRISEKIKLLINETLDGVEKSNVGGIVVRTPSGEVLRDQCGTPVYSQVGMSVFITTLNVVMLKNLDGGINV